MTKISAKRAQILSFLTLATIIWTAAFTQPAAPAYAVDNPGEELTDPSAYPSEGNSSVPGHLSGTGVHFEIKDSPYQDLVVETATEVTVRIESVPEIITFDFEPSSTAFLTTVFLSQLPSNITYHKYQDGYENYEALTTDSSGRLEFTQDLTAPHHVFLQTKPSTKTIDASATGRDCPLIGTWNNSTLTCTLTKNVNETIYITGTGVTLNGNGYTISAGTSAYGVAISNRNNITVKNLTIKNCSTGLYLYSNVSGVTITNNTIKENRYQGINLNYNVKNSSFIGNAVINNLGAGISLVSNSTNNTFSGNTISGNGNYATTYKMPGVDVNSAFNTFTNNTINDNWDSGIKIGPTGYVTLTGNTINANKNTGIYFNNGNGSVVQNNTLAENDPHDIYLNATFVSHCSQTITGNTGSGGRPIGFFNASGTISGGNYSQLVVCGVSGANINNISVEGSATKRNNGLYLLKSTYSNLSNITSQGNKYGIYLLNSDYNNLSGLTSLTNNDAGISLENSHHNALSSNNLSGNENGFYLNKSNNNTLENNEAHHNNYNGILLNNSVGNTLSNNNAYENAILSTKENDHYGIALLFDQQFPNLGNNTLTGNTISNNNGFNFALFSWSTVALRNNIDTSNTVDGRPIYYLADANGVTIDESTNAGTVYCINCTNVTVKNLDLRDNFAGVYLHQGVGCKVENIKAENNYVNIYGQYSYQNQYLNNETSVSRYGILLSPLGGCRLGTCKENAMRENESSENYYGYYFNADATVLTGNTAHNNYYGIYMYGPNSLVRNNTLSQNQIGIGNRFFTGNKVYNNNFLSNIKQAEIISATPLMNLPLPDGGNFWSDWTTPDADSDGFVDLPYIVIPTVSDNLPWTIENGWLPKTTISFAGEEGLDGWFKSEVMVTLTATDNNAIAQTEYSFDEVAWMTYSTPFAITEEGEITVFYRSTDTNGDREKTKQAAIKIDRTPPTIGATRTPEPNSEGWNNSDVTVAFTCTDDLSGVASCSPAVIVNTEGANQSVTGTATDKAGNTASFELTGINIDKTPPVISIVAPVEGEYLLNAEVLANWEAVDSLSGLAASSGTVDNGQLVDTSTAGEKTFTVSATDKAGNSTEKTNHYQVVYGFGGLLSPFDQGKGNKAGSTIPLKFQLLDANNEPILTAVARVFLISSEGVEVPGEAAGNSNEGNLFRLAGDQYLFNLKTDNLAPGNWQIKISLDDGTSNTALLVIR